MTAAKYLAPILLGFLLPVGCEPSADVSPPALVIIHEDDHGTADVSPPQRLDVVMNDDSEWVGRCENLGGLPQQEGRVCRNIDY